VALALRPLAQQLIALLRAAEEGPCAGAARQHAAECLLALAELGGAKRLLALGALDPLLALLAGDPDGPNAERAAAAALSALRRLLPALPPPAYDQVWRPSEEGGVLLSAVARVLRRGAETHARTGGASYHPCAPSAGEAAPPAWAGDCANEGCDSIIRLSTVTADTMGMDLYVTSANATPALLAAKLLALLPPRRWADAVRAGMGAYFRSRRHFAAALTPGAGAQ